MALLNADVMLGYLRNYRNVHIGGRYGGGKTALAWKLAYELCKRYKYRYIISNVASVWNDSPADVVLRDGKYVDAVIILDEGGLFIKNTTEAEQFMAYLRKLNIILLVPSVQPPSTRLRHLSIQRTWNVSSLAPVPLWIYKCTLSSGSISEKTHFAWWGYQEIFGIYDTEGLPSDDKEISDYISRWVWAVKSKTGYADQASRVHRVRASIDSSLLGADASEGQTQPAQGKILSLGESGGYADALNEVAESMERAVSVFDRQISGKRRR